jgi:hypothetical protein
LAQEANALEQARRGARRRGVDGVLRARNNDPGGKVESIIGLFCTCTPIVLMALGMGLLTVMAMGKRP